MKTRCLTEMLCIYFMLASLNYKFINYHILEATFCTGSRITILLEIKKDIHSEALSIFCILSNILSEWKYKFKWGVVSLHIYMWLVKLITG